jgi:hypothetical protein
MAGPSPMSNVALDLAVITRERKGRFVLFREIEAEANKTWLVQGLLGAGEASAPFTASRVMESPFWRRTWDCTSQRAGRGTGTRYSEGR